MEDRHRKEEESMEITVQVEARLPMRIIQKRKWFVASCPVLDVTSQADTEKEARNNLKEALSLFFLSCLERGTLEAVLKSCGLKILK